MARSATTEQSLAVKPQSTRETGELPETLDGLDEREAERLRVLWPDLDADQRKPLLQALRKLAKAHTEMVELEWEARRQRNIAHNQGLIQLINTWMEEDAQGDHEQQEREWQELKTALDEDRFSLPERNLFP